MNTQFRCQKTFLFKAIQFSQTVLFQTIQFSISTQFSSIWPIDRTLSGSTTLGQIGPGSDGNEGVLCIHQSSSITGMTPSDCLVSYPEDSEEGFYPSAEVQLVYSTVPVHLCPRRNACITLFFLQQYVNSRLVCAI